MQMLKHGVLERGAVVVAACCVLALAGCGGDDSDSSSASGSQGGQQSGQQGGGSTGGSSDEPTGGSGTVSVDGVSYAYESSRERKCTRLFGALYIDLDLVTIDGQPTSEEGSIKIEFPPEGADELDPDDNNYMDPASVVLHMPGHQVWIASNGPGPDNYAHADYHGVDGNLPTFTVQQQEWRVFGQQTLSHNSVERDGETITVDIDVSCS